MKDPSQEEYVNTTLLSPGRSNLAQHQLKKRSEAHKRNLKRSLQKLSMSQ